MKEVFVSYTVLDIIEVPDDWTDEKVEELLQNNAPIGYNDLEWEYVKRSSIINWKELINMLTINKTYCISSDDKMTTIIYLNKEDGSYNLSVTDIAWETVEVQLDEILASELFTALKELGNFV